MKIDNLAGGVRAVLLALAAFALAFGASPMSAQAQTNCQGEPSQTKLHVIVQGVRSAQGVMTATLYGDDPHRFLKDAGELKVWREPAAAPVTEMCLWLPGPGTYAVAVYHDAKRAMRFTQGAFGRPNSGLRLFPQPVHLPVAAVARRREISCRGWGNHDHRQAQVSLKTFLTFRGLSNGKAEDGADLATSGRRPPPLSPLGVLLPLEWWRSVFSNS